MATTPRPAGLVRFGAFEVDMYRGELRKHGIRIHIQEQPLRVLGMLLERPGELVTREALHRVLWDHNAFVDIEHNLNNAVARLREVLNDSAEKPRFIERLPRRGYRFLFPVEKDDRSGEVGKETHESRLALLMLESRSQQTERELSEIRERLRVAEDRMTNIHQNHGNEQTSAEPSKRPRKKN